MITELRLDRTEDVVSLHPVGPNCRVELCDIGALWRPWQESAVGSRGLIVTLLCFSFKTGAILQSGDKVVRLFLGGGPGWIGWVKIACGVRIVLRAKEDVAHLDLLTILLWNSRRDVADFTLLYWASEQLRRDLFAEGGP